jgi:uncharacterized protein (TIGR02270 family)
MSVPLGIVGCGAVTPVGLNVLQTCAAIRARVSGVRTIMTRPPDFAPVFGAVVPARGGLKEIDSDWLVSLAARAIREALSPESPDPSRTALLLSVPPPDADQQRQEVPWIQRVESRLKQKFHAASAVFTDGHAAPVRALIAARELLELGEVRHCLIAGVDSMVNLACVDRLAAWNRLHGEDNAQGVIPGEGAACVLVTRAPNQRHAPLALILGCGTASEADTVLGTRTSVGAGLLAALRSAQRDAGIDESLIAFRASDMTGERYRGLESMLAEARFYRTRRERFSAWLPAMSVGDIGAAAAPMALIVSAVAMARGYAPGECAMCELSSEQGLRGACVIARPSDLAAAQQPSGNAAGAGQGGGRTEYHPLLARARGGPGASAVIPTVIQQHAEEAAFLWLLRATAVHRADFSLANLAALDMRVESHLDGLRVAGESGWTVVEDQLAFEEPGEFFAAGLMAFEGGNPKWIERLLGALAEAPNGASGMGSVLGWMPLEQVKPWITRLLASKDGAQRLAGITAAAVHRHMPGVALIQAASGPDLRLRARALRAVGELGRMELIPTLRTNLSSADPPCRFWAAWSLALLSGDAAAVGILRTIAEAGGSRFAEPAAAMFARRSDPGVVKDWYRRRGAKPAQARVAIVAAAAQGEPDAIPWLLETMRQKPLARLAGEAFTFITGADLAKLNLTVSPPADSGAGPTESAADDEVAMDPDDSLPWPALDRVAAWWQSNAGSIAPGTRHLAGRPVAIEGLREVLRTGRQRQRAAAALELAFRLPGVPLFETRAAGFQQIAALERK